MTYNVFGGTLNHPTLPTYPPRGEVVFLTDFNHKYHPAYLYCISIQTTLRYILDERDVFIRRYVFV